MNSVEYELGSGNVFADLGLTHPEERSVRAELAWKIKDIIESRGWSQSAAAEVLGIDQPKVSLLLRGRLTGFSLSRLLRFLEALGQEVSIVIRDASSSDPGSRESQTTVPYSSRRRSAGATL